MPPPASEIKSKTLELFRLLRTQNQTTGWVRLRNQIAVLNGGLVEKLAGKYAEDGRESFEDLYQVGMIGLIKAVEKYDPGKGSAFSSYAVPYIRGEILHHRRDRTQTIKIPRSWSDKFSLLRQLLDDGASHQAMAAATRIPESQIQLALDALLRPGAISLDAPLAPGVEDCWEVADTAPVVTDWENEMGLNLHRRLDGYVNATSLCRAHRKRWHRYYTSARLNRYTGNLQRWRVRMERFYEPDDQGDWWVCPEVALDLLRWCQPGYTVALDSLLAGRY